MEFERLPEMERRTESLLRQAREDAAAVLVSAREAIRQRRVQPQLRTDIVRVRRGLDEREREERLRLSNLMRRRKSPGRLPLT